MAVELDVATEQISRQEQPADAAHSPQQQRQAATHPELGWEGAVVSGGIVTDDYNPDLRGRQAIDIAEKMLRGDAQVRAVLRVISLPIRSTSWFIEEPDGAGKAEKEAAGLLRENLFGGMAQSWDEVMRECCLAIYYGWRVPEIVWDEQDGRIIVKRLAPRSLQLVDRWIYDQAGELRGYHYQGNRPYGTGLQEWSSTSSMLDRVPVPIEKTIHLAYEPENGSPQGCGLWRSMYRPWYFKDALLRIMGIGIERNLLGVPVAVAGDGAQADDKSAMKTILSRLRAADDAAVVLPKGWTLDWFESTRTPLDAMPFLHYQDSQIALAGLAQMLNLGLQQHGTQAVGSVHSEHFQAALESDARWIEANLQRQLVKRWCLLNYGEGLKCPELRHRTIRARDIGAWTSALQQLVSGGFLHPTPDDEEKLRDEMELPEIDRELLEKKQAERDEAQKALAQRPPAPPEAPPPDEKREATDCGSAHRFAESEDAKKRRKERADREGDFTGHATRVLSEMLGDYLKRLRPLVEAAGKKPAGLERLAEVEIEAGSYETFVREFLWDVFGEGQRALAADTGGKASRRVAPKLRAWVNARAAVIAADHVAQIRLTALSRVLTGIRGELDPEQIFSAAGAETIERINRATAADWASAAQEVLSRLGDGRSD